MMGEELDEFSDALPYDDDPLPPNSSDITSDITSDAICDARVVPLSSGAPLNFANLALHDNLTTEAKAASESQKERLREFDSNNTVEGLTLGEVDRLPVSASSPPPPPTAPTVESPPPAAPTTPAPNALDDSSSTYTSPNSDAKFKMVNQDTGEVIDLRDLDSGKVEQPKFSLMPSKEEFLRRGSGASVDSDEESHATSGSKNTKGVAGKAKGFFKSMTGKSKAGGKPTSEPHKGAHSIPVQPSKVKGKDVQEFSDFVHVTHIPPSATQGHSGSVWCMEFSPDGKYLATGGADKIINVWEVARVPGSGKEGKEKKNKPPTNMGSDEKRGKGKAWKAAPPSADIGNVELFSGPPIRRFAEHKLDVISLSWSRTSFLLSGSMDKTVRLWHVSREECLHLFQHSDFVTAVCFHPLEDRYFLSGGFDKKLRIWSIPEGRVKEWSQAPEMVTSAAFSPTGMWVVAGLFHGQVYFYSTNDGLRYYTQIDAKNRHGTQKGGKKVTGLSFLRGLGAARSDTVGSIDSLRLSNSSRSSSRDSRDSRDSSTSSRDSSGFGRSSSDGSSMSERRSAMFQDQLLVSTNDSRLRLFSMDDFSQVMKYKGLVNYSMQISASFSESGEFIISGSENGSVYIWNTTIPNSTGFSLLGGGGAKKDKNKSYESFESTKASLPIVTEALFVPTKSVKHCFNSSGVLAGGTSYDTQYDLSASMVVASDYDGSIRVYLKKATFDEMVEVNRKEDVKEEFAEPANMNQFGSSNGGGANPGMFGSVGGGFDPTMTTDF